MRHRSRPIAALSLSLACAGLLVGASAPQGVKPQQGQNPEQGVSVTVKVTDLRNTKGVVRACITGDPKHFPKCKDGALTKRLTMPAASPLTLVFTNVAPGHYAIGLIHDEDNNGKLDRALLMMPKEGYGFSRDAKVVMGPPKFEAAAFDVGTEPVQQTIRMRYWF